MSSESFQDVPQITPAQALALAALLRGESMTAAAAAAGVERHTVTRWKSEPAFAEALAEAQHSVIGSAVDQLIGLAEEAAAVVVEAVVGQRLPWVALRVLDGLGVLTKRVALEMTAAPTWTDPPADLGADEKKALIELGRRLRKKPIPRQALKAVEVKPDATPAMEDSPYPLDVLTKLVRRNGHQAP